MPDVFEFTPDYSKPLKIGASGMEAILQNMRIIIQTRAFTVPFDRAFADDESFVDSPAPIKTAQLTSRLWDALEKWEPRIEVDSIDFDYAKGDLKEGRLCPKIVFHLKKGIVL